MAGRTLNIEGQECTIIRHSFRIFLSLTHLNEDFDELSEEWIPFVEHAVLPPNRRNTPSFCIVQNTSRPANICEHRHSFQPLHSIFRSIFHQLNQHAPRITPLAVHDKSS